MWEVQLLIRRGRWENEEPVDRGDCVLLRGLGLERLAVASWRPLGRLAGCGPVDILHWRSAVPVRVCAATGDPVSEAIL